MGIFKVVRPDEDVVSGDQVHHPEESRRGNITRERELRCSTVSVVEDPLEIFGPKVASSKKTG
jgi:hypothetical protein